MTSLARAGWRTTLPYAILVGIATVTRVVYIAGAGVVRGSDAPLYLGIARSVADGNPATNGYPLQALYGIALSPAYLGGIGVDRWVLALHVVLGVATVVVLYRLALIIVGRGMAFAVGTGVAIWPTFIYWSRWVLTETLFLFFLSCFLLVCTRQIITPSTGWQRWSILAVSASGVILTRSVGAFVVWVGLLVLLAAWARQRRIAMGVHRAVLSFVVASLLVVVAAFSIPATRDEVLSNSNVSYSLWASTRAFHSSVEHASRRTEIPRDIRSLPADAQTRELSDRALEFMRDRPGDYTSRAGIRFVSFWFPWLTADWSLAHRAFDAILSLALVVLALGSPFVVGAGPRRQVLLLFAAVAAVQALAVTFGELDSDGRYRVPVELCLLLIGAMTIDGVVKRRRALRTPSPPTGSV